ncbi:RNA polymerase sigma-70 factor [Ktedonospora formicarum]|nr:RNA polymerase sigma-70 factor [Ktedonospora formicarum]
MDEPISQEEEFEHYRSLLFTIAYRMTGSASDAEDLVQETYLRYQANASQDIVSLKSYLTTIITRLSLDYLKSARVAREQYFGVWLPEPILTTGDNESLQNNLEKQEALSLAFLCLLEALNPPERAVFLLHEVFDYPFSEIGTMLEKSSANCRQIFHRARQALQDRRTRFEPEPQRQRQFVLSFLSASQAGDMAALTSLLSQETISWSDGGGKIQTNFKPIYGQQAVARFWCFWLSGAYKNNRALLHTLEEINGNPAILFWDEGKLVIAISMTLNTEGIQDIYTQMNPDKLAYLQKQLSSTHYRPENRMP